MATNLDSILELIGLRLGNCDAAVIEGKNHAAGKLLLCISGNSEAALTPTEARYLAEKLNGLADKVERKAKAAKPCCECGK